MSLRKVQVADNMDLLGIMMEFEAYYQIKFGKVPKFVRKVGGAESSDSKRNLGGNAQAGSTGLQRLDQDFGMFVFDNLTFYTVMLFQTIIIVNLFPRRL